MARSPTTISSGTILGFYPPSIAHAFQRATNGEPADADLLYEDLLGALLSHLAWTCALATGGRGVAEALGNGPASLGTLLQLVRAASSIDRGDRCEALIGTASGFATSPLHATLEEAIRLRNAVIHEHRLDLRESARTAVRRSLDHASSLRFQAVLVPRALEEMRGSLRVYRAALYRGVSLRHPVSIETDVDLVPKQAYLAIEGRAILFPLHPFLIEGESCAGGALSELYATRDLGRLSVRSAALGREAPPRVKSQVESALRVFEPRDDPVVKPRHFSCPSLAIVASRRLGPGDEIANEYRIVQYIGSGHSSDVYEAVNVRGEACALKLVSAEIASEAQVLERFRREVGVLRRIRHRNVLRHVDDGEDAGARFVVTELASGWAVGEERVRDASELLKHAHADGSAGLDEATVLNLARDVAAGLAELHERGIVHRDVKLANVLLFEGDDGRRAVLGDLGIARGFGSSAVTYDGLPVGTPESMAPECGESPDAAPTLDVYAFGILLYEALTGSPPFRGATPQETRAKHRSRLPPLRDRAPNTSDGMVSLVRACLAKNPASRPKHGADLHARLERLHETLPDPPAVVDIVRGHRLGHYVVHEPIGEIEGATLFRAIDDRTGATVRVGILDDAVESDEVLRRRALEILAALQAVQCETLVRVREYGEGDGYTWFLTEDTVQARLCEARDLDAVTVVSAALGSADALGVWRAQGFVHGDIRNALRIHRLRASDIPRALLELPALRSGGADSDVQDLAKLALESLETTDPGAGHVRRARARALTALRRLNSGRTPALSELAVWARASCEDLRDGSLLGRSLRAVRRQRAVSAALVVLAVSAAGFGLHRVSAQAALEDRAEGQLRLIAAHVQLRDYCEALTACRADEEAAADTPALGGRASILEIYCAHQQRRPQPPLRVLEPLERALQSLAGREATREASAEPAVILQWVTDQLKSREPIPRELAYSFWRLAARAVYAGFDKDAPTLDACLEVASLHYSDDAPPRARAEMDAMLSAQLESKFPAMQTNPLVARNVVDLVEQRLHRTEPAWNQFELDCYDAIARATLDESDPIRRDAARRRLQYLGTPSAVDEGLRHATDITNRVFESGYLPSSARSGFETLRARCQLRALELEPKPPR